MLASNYRHRINFYELDEGISDSGWPTEEWIFKFSLWAGIKTLKGTEFFASAAQQYKNYYRFIVRYNKNVRVRQQIEFEGVRYEIESVLNDDERKQTMTIIAVATV
ncbi:phage head closure protein [Lysinibacillus sp. FSL W8-0992]|uniref:phage head closure protein n=1 Tax=Lysinibacillus sp. FSL W8-0992 TaxID=2954643 RepID=UPI0030FBEA77